MASRVSHRQAATLVDRPDALDRITERSARRRRRPIGERDDFGAVTRRSKGCRGNRHQLDVVEINRSLRGA